MTGTKRIILNTVATYGRSVLGIFLGLFSARWVLAALGKSDLGLFGVVGSIIVCVQLLNIVMSSAVARYYAFAIGRTKDMSADDARELMLGWFNSAMAIHTVLPAVLVAIGYPAGVWVIMNWLVVPDGRIEACIWVFRLSLVAAFFNMATVPYIAMYRAKQLIAELTVWEVVRNIITFSGAFALLYVGGDHLIIYAAIMSLAPVAILIVQSCRARRQFDCCKVQWELLFDVGKMRQIVVFGLCDLMTSIGCIVRDQGAAFLINKVFGPVVNSAYSIANQLSSQTTSLAGAMNGALMPAITTTEGEGQHAKAVMLAHRSCKFCTLLVLLFAVPLAIEADEVLRLWLVNPPEYTADLCRCVLVTAVCFKLGWGYHMAILADGRVALYQMTVGSISVATLPVMFVLTKFFGVLGVGYALAANAFALSIVRVFYGKFLVGVKISYWLLKVLLPLSVVAAVSLLAGLLPCRFMEPSFMRIVVTTIVSVLVLAGLSWLMLLDSQEKRYILDRVSGLAWFGKKR